MNLKEYYGKRGFILELFAIGIWLFLSTVAFWSYGFHNIDPNNPTLMLAGLFVGVTPLYLCERIFRLDTNNPIFEKVFSVASILVVIIAMIVIPKYVFDIDKIYEMSTPTGLTCTVKYNVIHLYGALVFIPFIIERVFRLVLSIIIMVKKD